MQVQTQEDEAPPPDQPEEPAQATTLGLERWVYFGFAAAALVAFVVLSRLVKVIWDYFAEPNELLTIAIGAVGGIVLAFGLYKHAKVNRLAHEVVQELAKVTWPARPEIRVATVVVIVTSLVAAAIIGTFDFGVSWVTDLIYGVKKV